MSEPSALTAADRAFGLACPHCGLRAMSAPRKWVIGWGSARVCQSCGQRVEIDGLRVMAVTAPFILGCLALAVWAGVGGRFSPVLALWCLSALALLGFLGYVLAVPLRRVGRTDPQAVAHARRLAGEQG